MEEKDILIYDIENRKKAGKFLKELRMESKYTREKLAQLLDLSHDSVAGYERGDRLPSAEAIYILCQLFDVTFDEILAGRRNTESSKRESTEHLSTTENIPNSISDPLPEIASKPISLCSDPELSLCSSETDRNPTSDKYVVTDVECRDDNQSNNDNHIKQKPNYLRLGFYALICALVIALIAWFINLWLIRRDEAAYLRGTISTSIEEISLPEGETIFNEGIQR